MDYQEVNVTSWLWPNYITDITRIQVCNPEQPTYLLESSYSIKVTENNPQSFNYFAFEHWRGSKFMFRICTNLPSINVIWNTPDWISLDQLTGNFIIETSKIESVGSYDLNFQSQLFGLSFGGDHYLENITSSYQSTFVILNENWFLMNSQINNWYILLHEMKNSTLQFFDNENDTITLKLVDTESRFV